MPCVKCKDCGYLGIRDPFSPTSPITEAYELVRETGWQNASNGHRTVARLRCYEKKREFGSPKVDQPHKLVVAISEEIECDAFIEWLPGRSPEKHKDLSLLEKAREEYREAQQRADRKADEREAQRGH